MKSNHIRIAVILGAVSVAVIIVFQIYWINRSFNLAERQFNQTVSIALYQVAEKMAAFNNRELPNEHPVRQISSNYFIVDINDVIDASILDHYLKSEFEYSNIRIDYEYAIYDCETNRMVFGNYIKPGETGEKANEKFQKYDEFTYYFGILFPSKTIYILKSMNIWIISAFVLITVLIFFAYAIYVILRQKRLSEIQKDFINNMTHEFKTPISTISISAKVLGDKEILNNPERLSSYASIIEHQSKRLENHVEKVLQLARIEKGKPDFNMEEVHLHDLIHEVAGYFRISFRESELDLRLDLQAGRDEVIADPGHLSNLIYNLIDNAVKYSEGKPQINIDTENQDDRIRMTVADKGIGIESKYLSKVFDKFFRVPTGNIHKVKGFGLGLNYVKSISHIHHWELKAESEPGQGSRFSVFIPLKK